MDFDKKSNKYDNSVNHEEPNYDIEDVNDEDIDEIDTYYCPFCKEYINDEEGMGCEHVICTWDDNSHGVYEIDDSFVVAIVSAIKKDPDKFMECRLMDCYIDDYWFKLDDYIDEYCNLHDLNIETVNKKQIVKKLLSSNEAEILNYDYISSIADKDFIYEFVKCSDLASLLPTFRLKFSGDKVPHHGWFGFYYGIVSDNDLINLRYFSIEKR